MSVVEATSISVVALLERQGTAVEQTLAASAVRDAFGQLAGSPTQSLGEVLERLERQRLTVDRVAAEQLVGTLAGQHDLDVLARFLRDEPQRNQCRIGYRVVEVPDDLGNGSGELGGGDHLDDVLRADRCGRFCRDVDLGIALTFETGREGDQVGVVAHRQRRDRRGVDTTGQERTDGDVGAHVLGDRILECLGDFLVARLLGARCKRLGRELRREIPRERGLLARTHPGEAARLQASDLLVQCFRLRYVLQNGVVLDGTRIQLGTDADQIGEFEQALLLAAERGATGAGRDEQRLDPERIARDEQLACVGVPDREREHSAQAPDRVLTPVVECSDDGLGVALGEELGVVVLDQFGADLQVVVDLAVERERITLRVLRWAPTQRLVGMSDVDDRQAVEPEDEVIVVPRPVFVRPAVTKAMHRLVDPRDGVLAGSARCQ